MVQCTETLQTKSACVCECAWVVVVVVVGVTVCLHTSVCFCVQPVLGRPVPAAVLTAAG